MFTGDGAEDGGSEPGSLRCVLLGEGTLLLRCGAILLDRGHQVLGVVSRRNSVAEWARSHGVLHVDVESGWRRWLAGEAFDYLFSIVNSRILDDKVTRLPKKATINYHDGPLPRYAGLNATSWALFHGETTHGVTWHLVTQSLDGGDILKQRLVDVEPAETALSLNAKCFDAGAAAFRELIDDLAAGRLDRRPQDSSRRTYFGRKDRPAAACTIDWTRSAAEISSLVRALEFGPYDNSLGLPKLWSGSECLIVSTLEVAEQPTSTPAGTILHAAEDGILIATATAPVAIRRCRTLEGRELSTAEILDRLGLRPGQRLPILNDQIRGAVSAVDAACGRSEDYWIERLTTLDWLAVSSIVPSRQVVARSRGMEERGWTVPDEIMNWLAGHGGIHRPAVSLLAVLGVYLARRSGTDRFDLAIHDAEGTPITTELAPWFAAFLPLPFSVSFERPLADVLAATGLALATVRKQGTHARDLPLRYPDLARRYPNGQGLRPSLGVVLGGSPEALNLAEDCDLVIQLPSQDARVVARFDASVCPADVVERLLRSFGSYLERLATSGPMALERIPLVGDAESRQLCLQGIGEQRDIPHAQAVHELFEEQSRRTPGATAVLGEDQSLTYRELNERANRLARHLIGQGVGPETVVGIYVGPTPDRMTGLLAILKAGGTYLPLDPAHPLPRVDAMLKDAGASLICTQAEYRPRFREFEGRVICLEDFAPPGAPHDNPSIAIRPGSLAYVLFTSGSTGRPKGVMVPHQALLNHCVAIADRFRLQATDRVLQFTSLSFDVAAEEIFPTWAVGGCVVCAAGAAAEIGPEFPRKLDAWGVTVVNLSSSAWRSLLEIARICGLACPDSLRLAVAGTEPMTAMEWNALREWTGEKVVWLNAYGTTETTITSTIHEPDSTQAPLAQNIPIGRPIRNVETYVLDRWMHPVPVDVPGELYIGGLGLARGYVNAAGLTNERFRASPFDPAGAQRLYRTGDLARWRPDGDLELLGRADDQIKIRGVRIQPAEIEAALREHPAVREVVVTATATDNGERQLTAYIVREALERRPELWPCPGDFRVYDEVMYYAMTHDEYRNHAYREAIRRWVPGKTVVDIGTGKDVVWGRYCVEVGARHVYAIEVQERAFEQAKRLVRSLGLEERISLIHGDSREVTVPEPVDVCVSELIGNIGSSEGVIPLIDDARRFLKRDGVMIPARCVTRIAAVTLPEAITKRPGFAALPAEYVRRIFQKTGRPFDLRIAIKDFPMEEILSNHEVFEDLDFRQKLELPLRRELAFTIHRSARLDGFLLWLNLHAGAGRAIENLTHLMNWLPVYFPAFPNGVDVIGGDRIEATCRITTSSDGLNPDYRIWGRVLRPGRDDVPFDHQSLLHEEGFRQSPFTSAHLAANEPAEQPTNSEYLSPESLRTHLAKRLPAPFLPSNFVFLDSLPRLPSGKVDRHALPTPDASHRVPSTPFVPPRNPWEEKIAAIWRDVLRLDQVGIHDNFFSLGGHSLVGMVLLARLEADLGWTPTLSALFHHPTIAELAGLRDGKHSSQASRIVVPIQSGGARTPLWCLHCGYGYVHHYQRLGALLGADQPVFGLQPPGLDGSDRPPGTVEEMGAKYVREILQVQPSGPYRLCGFSFGGVVAVEMARQLMQMDMRVEIVALFDSYLYHREAFAFRAKRHLRALASLPPAGAAGYMWKKLLGNFRTFARSVQRRSQRSGKLNISKRHVKQGIPIPVELQGLHFYEQCGRAWRRFRPQAYSGRLVLFRQAERSWFYRDVSDLGWGSVSPRLEIVDIPGVHGEMLREPHVREVARRLREMI